MSTQEKSKKNKSAIAIMAAFAGLHGALGLYAHHYGPQQEDAENALRSHGFSQIRAEHSYATGMLYCRMGEMFNSYNFTAKNHKDENVSGFVCQRLTKGATLHF